MEIAVIKTIEAPRKEVGSNGTSLPSFLRHQKAWQTNNGMSRIAKPTKI